MAYDLEKYRRKREKVLGVRKRGVSFGTLAAVISLGIVLATGALVVPKSIAFFNNRLLDDVIYKVQGVETPDQTLLAEVGTLAGVKAAAADTGGSRLIITFDKSLTDPARLSAFFNGKGLRAVMLNQVGHHQRHAVPDKEGIR